MSRSRNLLIRRLPSEAPAPMVAFAASRRLGNAVCRNRVRRRCRAAIAQLTKEHRFPSGVYLVSFKPGAVDLKWSELLREFERATARWA